MRAIILLGCIVLYIVIALLTSILYEIFLNDVLTEDESCVFMLWPVLWVVALFIGLNWFIRWCTKSVVKLFTKKSEE